MGASASDPLKMTLAMSEWKSPQQARWELTQGWAISSPLAPGATSHLKLPTGVTDLDDWGSTVCKLPRVVNLRLSFAEMATDVKNPGE